MHPYATDTNARTTVPLIIAGAAIISAWLLARALTALEWSVPWWVDAPSVMGFYGLYTTLFDRWLWRRSLLRWLGLVNVPDLNGTWDGQVASSSGDQHYNHDATVTITQRWSRMTVRLTTDHSHSHSLSAALLDDDTVSPTLSYEYVNEPRAGAAATMHPHRGTARLTLQRRNGSEVLNGEYYTGRGRQTYGTLCVERLRRS
jgi:hypothetical protein